MIDFSPRPHTRGNVGTGRQFHGTATCGKRHRWECVWTFEPFTGFIGGRQTSESKQVITPECCPACNGKALTLAPNKKTRTRTEP